MAGYVRKTVLSPAQVLEQAREILSERVGLSETKRSGHEAVWEGEEGRLVLHAHTHSLYTEVTASTNQLRTSRMDYEVQKFLNRLPYEAFDRGGPGSGDPVPVAPLSSDTSSSS
jgi:hypothetical protein